MGQYWHLKIEALSRTTTAILRGHKQGEKFRYDSIRDIRDVCGDFQVSTRNTPLVARRLHVGSAVGAAEANVLPLYIVTLRKYLGCGGGLT